MDDQFLSQNLLNSMILRPPAHKVGQLKPYQKNLEIQAIILDIREKVYLRNQNQHLTKFVIADDSGSVYFNVFDQWAEGLEIGDILYINNAYTTKYSEQLILYHGKMGILKKLDEFYFKWQENPFVSKLDWSAYTPNNQQGNQNSQQNSNQQQQQQQQQQQYNNKGGNNNYHNNHHKNPQSNQEPKLKKKIKHN